MKRLYLQVHEPELAAQPDGAADAIIEQGREVDMLARQLFPGGIEVRSDGGLDQAIRATRELVANADVPAIFEGTFEYQNVLVRVDILHRRRDRRWRLIEVKSNTNAGMRKRLQRSLFGSTLRTVLSLTGARLEAWDFQCEKWNRLTTGF